MKTVLAISDSVEGTPYDLKRTTKTIKGYKMDPLLVVPAIFERSGNHVVNPSDEILEYVFGDDCDLSAITIGYMTEQDVVEKVASRLHQLGKGKVPIIYQPSLFTDDGEILVNEDLYYSICDNLLPCVDLIIINRFEAELLSEMECHTDGDFTNAAREISKQFRCSVLIRHVEGKGRKNLLFNGVSSLWIITPPHLIDGANKNYNLMSAVACSMAEKPLIGSAIRNAIYFCSIDKTKPQELYEEEELEEYVEHASEVAVVPEEAVIPEIVVEEVQEIVEEPVQVEPELSDEETIQIIEEVQAVEEKTEEAVIEEVVVEETPAVEAVATKTVEEPKVEEPVVNKVSAADAIAAAKAQSGLLFGGNMPEHRQKVRAPLTSTPVPKFGSNSILGNSKSIIAAPSASEPSSTTTTSSLVSPVKTLRDIARTLDNISRDGEEIPAVTSTIEKPAPGPKAPVSDLTPESTAVRLQSLRERLNNMTGSDKH
ncbi:MAG: hydroxymethylpyrimidine/phosphomethylpyrimidine kinase [Saccharofermentans sp.]|nr:hydroxymethylpyrimidine/phosphomethylpyrimidine kinase [Saccharofermentans sp.]